MSTPRPLILRGHLTIDDVDVAKQTRAFTIRGRSDIAERPPTQSNPHWRPTRAGQRWTLEFTMLSSPVAGSLSRMLYDAYIGIGVLPFSGAVTRDPIGEDNPLWSGQLLISEWGIGGDRRSTMTETFTFRMTGPPVMETW